MRRRQNGQALLLVVLLLAVLLGFIGLVIDGGEVSGRQLAAQSAADGAALTASSAVGRQGLGITGAAPVPATQLAQNVVLASGFPVADLTLAYQSATGVAVIDPTLVRKVVAVVTDTRSTYFLSALGIRTSRVTATGTATVYGLPPNAQCVLCVLAPATTDALNLAKNSTLTISGGGVTVDSTAAEAALIDKNVTYSAPATVVAGGVNTKTVVTPPAIRTQPLAADPFANTPVPSRLGLTTFADVGGGSSIGPGIYQRMTLDQRDVTLTAGIYIVTGPIFIDQGVNVDATAGVFIYLSCQSPPCAGGGGSILLNDGTLTITAPASGQYRGRAVFADPKLTGANAVATGTLTVSGTYYTPLMAFSTGDTANFSSQVLVSTFFVDRNATATVAWSALQNYANPVLSP